LRFWKKDRPCLKEDRFNGWGWNPPGYPIMSFYRFKQFGFGWSLLKVVSVSQPRILAEREI